MKHMKCFLLCCALLATVLIRSMAAVDPAGGKLVTVQATKDASARRLAIVEKCAKAGLTPAEREKIRQELVLFDRGLITTWAHNLKFADGRAFTREIDAQLIADDRLARLYPDTFFYVVQLPGYLGGAAPSDEILRSLAVPAPLQRSNVFAVSKDATLRLLTGLMSREQYFQSLLPPIKTAALARTAAAAWLRLTQEYIWYHNYRPSFSITEMDFPVKELHGNYMNLEVTGKAVVDPKSNAKGDITVVMRFAVDGKLQFATETNNVEFGMIPLPPSAAPGGPGGGATVQPE
ncbi:MAG: hypothetical protein ACYC7E_00985 [Armatimonadota bacterium]